MDEIEQHLSSCDSCCQCDPGSAGGLAGRKAPRPWRRDGRGAGDGRGVRLPSRRSGFQVPSSFVVGPDVKLAFTTNRPSPGRPLTSRRVAGLPEELNDHPRYRVVAALGAGGMGAVYRAEHRLMDRPVALKVIRGDLLGNEAMVERFRREVKSAARLASHPNIVAAYDAEQAGETHMLVMEFVEGTDLARLVDRRGPLPVGEACEYVRQAALGLQHAFEDGMVHRDIKPQNLMRTTRGQIKILDFGLARFASEVATHAGVTAEGMILGSADYIAPEQIDDPHAADIRADIYSLGCTLYFLLAGRPPFPDGSVIQKLMAHREKTPRPLGRDSRRRAGGAGPGHRADDGQGPGAAVPTPEDVAQALAPFADVQAARAAATGVDASAAARAHRTGDFAFTGPECARSCAIGQRRPTQVRPRRPWVRTAAALAILAAGAVTLALITYRIQTGIGELVIESDDRDIEVIVKQGGEQVTIIDPRTKNRIELNAGRYELQLAGGGARPTTVERHLHAQARGQNSSHRAAPGAGTSRAIRDVLPSRPRGRGRRCDQAVVFPEPA